MIGVIQAYLMDTAADPAVLAAALCVARRFGSHIDVIRVCPEGPASPGGGGSVATSRPPDCPDWFEAWRKREGIEVVEAPQRLGRVSARCRRMTGVAEQVVVECGRLADLIVMARPGESRAGPVVRPVTCALFGCARPVLVVPPDGPVDPFGTALVAWNASVAATRAVVAALPFLKRGRDATVFSVREMSDAGVVRAADLVGYLAWQGVTAAAATSAAPVREVGPELLREAVARGAGLLVMGAYTQGWLYQRMLGGATEHVLKHAPVPVLMAH